MYDVAIVEVLRLRDRIQMWTDAGRSPLQDGVNTHER